MKDYQLQIAIKNNYLLTAMRENGYFFVPRLAEASGVSSSAIYEYLSLRKGALTLRRGAVRASVQRLADFLKRTPDQLFPSQHFDRPLKTNKATMEVDLDDMKRMFHDDLTALPPMLPDAVVEEEELRRMMGECLDTLLPREKRVLELRFGLDGEDQLTFEEISQRLVDEGVWPHLVQKERIRQIEAKAMRKLKHPSRSRELKVFLPEVGSPADDDQ